jgi:hypothetical protein
MKATIAILLIVCSFMGVHAQLIDQQAIKKLVSLKNKLSTKKTNQGRKYLDRVSI